MLDKTSEQLMDTLQIFCGLGSMLKDNYEFTYMLREPSTVFWSNVINEDDPIALKLNIQAKTARISAYGFETSRDYYAVLGYLVANDYKVDQA